MGHTVVYYLHIKGSQYYCMSVEDMPQRLFKSGIKGDPGQTFGGLHKNKRFGIDSNLWFCFFYVET